MAHLSHREKQILEYICKVLESRGYPPSVREIGLAVNLKSSSTVHGYLASLEEKGYIRRDPTKPPSHRGASRPRRSSFCPARGGQHPAGGQGHCR